MPTVVSVAEAIRKRRMRRHFRPDPVDTEVVARIAELGLRAPSAGNSQGQSLIIVTDPSRRSALARICREDEDYLPRFRNRWISEAPVQIVLCSDESAYHRRYQQPDKLRPDGNEIEWPVKYWDFDAGATFENLHLAAIGEGLACGYVGFPDFAAMDAARKLLGIEPQVKPLGIICLGHPAPDVVIRHLDRECLRQRIRWDTGDVGTGE